MYCPMKFNQIAGHSQGFSPCKEDSSQNCICDGQDCAWWIENEERCAITDIALNMEDIRISLDIIQSKTPN